MKQYKFGDCIPESVKIYNRLKRKGYNPKMVEGWVEVDIDRALDILPNKEALELYYPDLAKMYFDEGNEFSDYPRIITHTWIILDKEIIDITKNQFDVYGGIVKYFEKMRYIHRGTHKLEANDITDNWFDDEDYIIEKIKRIHYPEFKGVKC